MSKLEAREERVALVNRIILEIASRGRMFMRNFTNGDISYFVQEGKTLWFIDKHKGKKIYPYNNHEHYGFSDGGTLWGLVNDFRHFIITGEKCNGKYGYGGLYCPHWGYPDEDMLAIRQTAKQLGYLN